METRIASGTWGKGPVFAWMRPRVALVEGETLSPLQRLMTAVDSVEANRSPSGTKKAGWARGVVTPRAYRIYFSTLELPQRAA